MEPASTDLERMLYDMENEYESIRTNVTGVFDYQHYRNVLRKLNYQGTPGYPYCREASTIGTWLGFDGIFFNEERVQALWIDVQNVISGDFSESYWRVFIKPEAHKRGKAETKRWRIIMCSGLAVQVVWQMMFSEMNSREIENALDLPSQQGLVLCGGSWKLFYRQWIDNGQTYGTDHTAWDWTVPGWMLRADLEFRMRMSYGDNLEEWKRVAANLYEDAFHHPKIYLSDGRVYRQEHWGVQKSGCVNTISTNSHGGAMLHCLYSYEYGLPLKPFSKTVGDDKLQTKPFVEHIEFYEKYGFIIKEVTEDCEFVGHKFGPKGPVPLYLTKHLYSLKYADKNYVPEILDAYLRLYVNSTEIFDFWMEIAEILGLAQVMRSRNYYEFWYHNPLSLEGVKIDFGKFKLDYGEHGLLVN
ncbi:putative RNA-dependent RNA polymerase [Erysiphe necator associated sobemo-like virus 2]|nr:putative RNA-dependent RNA polymerase [Erysiphe necator associated sobemo-like virus 2]